jgi:hypothetical protein
VLAGWLAGWRAGTPPLPPPRFPVLPRDVQPSLVKRGLATTVTGGLPACLGVAIARRQVSDVFFSKRSQPTDDWRPSQYSVGGQASKKRRSTSHRGGGVGTSLWAGSR